MDPEIMDKKIIDLSDDELIELGFWGDQAAPRVKAAVEAVKADPTRLGYMTRFMIECVKDQHAVPARGSNTAAPQSSNSPSSPTFPTSPTFSDPKTIYTMMSNDSDAHTVVAPHLITKFERRFYYNGISGDPPELLYRSDLETNDFYVPTPGAPFSKIPTKTPNGVFGSVLNPIWDETVAPKIIAAMKTNRIKYSALKTVQFTTTQDDQVTIGPIVIWIAVKPNTTNAEALRDFTPDILRILSDSQITDMVVEWYEGEISKLTGPPLLPVVNRKNPAFGLNHPFNTGLGIPIARQTADDGQGTISLLFKEVKTRDEEPSARVLAITNKHVACVDTKTDYKFDGTNPLPMLVCGDRRYERAVTDIKAAVSKGVRQAAKLSGEIKDLEAKKGTAEEDDRSLMLLNAEFQVIEGDNAIRRTLFVEATTEWKNSGDRKFGIVDFAPKISATVDRRRYTFDFATIDVDLTKLVHFKSNIIDLGNQFEATELEDLFWPVDLNGKAGTIPANLQLPISSALPRRLVINPDTEGKNGEPLYVAKYGSSTNLTLGRYSGMDAYTCDEFGIESREVVVYNYTKAEGRKTSGDFSNHGDSGALIFTGKGEALAILHSGMPRGLYNHVTYGTPIWWIIEQARKEYPFADFYGMAYTLD